MSRIKSKNSEMELQVRRFLTLLGLRYRIYYGKCKIDIAFPKIKLALFLDSCFWHCCPLHFKFPKTNEKFWRRKFERNVERDREVGEILEKEGWGVVRVWEHDLEDLGILPRKKRKGSRVSLMTGRNIKRKETNS